MGATLSAMTATTASSIQPRRHLSPTFAVRAYDLGARCDTFLVVAVASVLGNRVFLIVTGYPQLGDGTLHISHAIWGALMLAASVVMSISFLGPFTRKIVAVVGGAGFGWFVDELGKFITRKVNYFFEPTIAIIYMTFIALYLAFRALERRRYTPEEGTLNALEAVKAAALGQLREPERRETLRLLDVTNPDTSAFVDEVRALLAHAPSLPPRRPSVVTRWADRAREWYLRLTEWPGFVVVIDVLFSFLALTAVVTVIAFVLDGPGVRGVDEWAALTSSLVANGCLLVGVFLLRSHDRMRAYRWLDRGLLISIFVTQVFVFADEQLGGTVGLLIVLIIWVLLRGAMRAEAERVAVEEAERGET